MEEYNSRIRHYTESGLKLPGLDLANLATQGACAGAQPNAYTGYGISRKIQKENKMLQQQCFIPAGSTRFQSCGLPM